jgi:glycosyltransferase involved in cell wall biosynthesis
MHLGHAFSCKGIECDLVEVSWANDGWLAALRTLWCDAGRWSKKCVILQYTALGWSRRGFPLGFLLTQYVLRLRSVRFAIVYHDPLPFSGSRFVDRIRRRFQVWVMRKSLVSAASAIVTIPAEKIDWLRSAGKVGFVPVGANIPASDKSSFPGGRRRGTKTKTVGIFGVTGGASVLGEATDIAWAVRAAQTAGIDLRVLLFGRNSLDAEPLVRRALGDTGIVVEGLGLLDPKSVTAAFSQVDVVLFVRGGISTRRGSAIAAIANGLPIVAYESQETSFPITEAGVVLVPPGDVVQLGQQLRRILSDEDYRRCLCDRSALAHDKYFSWPVIAESFVRILAHKDDQR